MNARLTALADLSGMPAAKVAELARILGEDGAEDVIARAAATEKSADYQLVAYKADGGDIEIPPEVDDALVALYESLGGDWDAVIAKLATPAVEVEQKRADPRYPPTGLVDQKKKAAEWSFASAVQGVQNNGTITPRW